MTAEPGLALDSSSNDGYFAARNPAGTISLLDKMRGKSHDQVRTAL